MGDNYNLTVLSQRSQSPPYFNRSFSANTCINFIKNICANRMCLRKYNF